MSKKNILFICVSMNLTTMMFKISQYYDDYNCYFTPYYADGFVNALRKVGLLDFTILGGQARKKTEKFLNEHNLSIDYAGKRNDYDLVFTCSDLIVTKNIRKKKLILVQEGMTDPESIAYFLIKWVNLPRFFTTAATGLSDAYDKFCVASEGYKKLFIRKGADHRKIVVTGIPNFDNAKMYLNNNFPHKNYVLAATSDARETWKYENRKKFINKVVQIANGKQIIFKLHPNENKKRAIKEINKYAPGSLIYTEGNTNEMIANCDVLVTKYSSVVYVGLALGKEVFSDFNIDELRELNPIQNGDGSAEKIAQVGFDLLDSPLKEKYSVKARIFSGSYSQKIKKYILALNNKYHIIK